MSVQQQIDRIEAAKEAIATAIAGKGVTVPDGTLIDGMAPLIESIEAGGGGEPSGGVSVETCSLTTAPLANQHTNSSSCFATILKNGEITAEYIKIPATRNTLVTENIVKGSLLYATVAYLTGVTKIIYNSSSHFRVDGDIVIGDNPCYARDTTILLADGTTKPVQDIEYSDLLLVWDFDNGCQSTARPVWIKKAQTATYYYKCTLSDGTVLNLIGSDGKCHRLLDIEKGSFESATNCVGKRVMTINGEAILESCERVDEEIEFYNIITHTHINLYAENILTSCRLNNLYPIKDMKFVKESRTKKNREDFPDIGSDMFRGLRIAEQTMSNEEITAYVNRLYALMDRKPKYMLTINNESVVMNEKEYFAHFGEDDIRQYVSDIYHARISIEDVPEDVRERVSAAATKRTERFGTHEEQHISDKEALDILTGGASE